MPLKFPFCPFWYMILAGKRKVGQWVGMQAFSLTFRSGSLLCRPQQNRPTPPDDGDAVRGGGRGQLESKKRTEQSQVPNKNINKRNKKIAIETRRLKRDQKRHLGKWVAKNKRKEINTRTEKDQRGARQRLLRCVHHMSQSIREDWRGREGVHVRTGRDGTIKKPPSENARILRGTVRNEERNTGEERKKQEKEDGGRGKQWSRGPGAVMGGESTEGCKALRGRRATGTRFTSKPTMRQILKRLGIFTR